MTEIKQDSLRKRYLLKLTGNLIGLGVGIITQSIVPRALGPSSYGNFSFLTGFFWQVVGFLNLNSSTAFYTKLSQRQHEKRLVNFYLYFAALLAVVVCLFPIIVFLAGKNEFIWPGQEREFILMGAGWALLSFCMMVLGDMCDAYAVTVQSESAKAGMKVLGLVLILSIYFAGWFSLRNFFIYQFFTLSATCGALVLIISKYRHAFSEISLLTKKEIRSYLGEFTPFCAPLVLFSGVAVLEAILDRWFLQQFSGSRQQGFYGLAYQIGAIGFTFASAMVPLVAREQAMSFVSKNIVEMGRTFSRFMPMLYSIVAYFACFFAVEARNIVLIFGGKAYLEAVLPIAVMSFFPIHQTYGQLNATVFFATGETVLYRNIGLMFTLIGIPATFFLLGPREYGGLQAGALGLAAKMVVLQVLSSNVQLWFHARLMRLSFRKFLLHQVVVVAVFAVVAVLCSYCAGIFLPAGHFLIQFIISGLLYTIGIAAIGFYCPWFFSLRKGEIAGLLGRLAEKAGLAR